MVKDSVGIKTEALTSSSRTNIGEKSSEPTDSFPNWGIIECSSNSNVRFASKSRHKKFDHRRPVAVEKSAASFADTIFFDCGSRICDWAAKSEA
jgi:hypothetical protein